MGIDPLSLGTRRLLNLRYSMMFTPFTEPEAARKLRELFGWEGTREAWGRTPAALAEQEAMAGLFPDLDV